MTKLTAQKLKKYKLTILPINNDTYELITVNNALSAYLKSLTVGRKATPRSWLYEHKDAKSILQRWLPIMEEANKKSPLGKDFDEFDRKQIEKFGPQGEVPPITDAAVLAVLEPLYIPSRYNDSTAFSSLFEDAHEFAKVAFGPRLCSNRPKSFKRVVDDIRAKKNSDSLTSNSGFPRFIRRNLVIDAEIQDATTGKAYEYPAIILFRQYNGKLRPVWMFPMSLNLIEFSFAQPIQEALLNSQTEWIRDYVTPWRGFDDVKVTLTDSWEGEQLIGGDTTKMDANMRLAQIELVFEIVKWFYQVQYWDDLHRSLQHICTIDLLVSTDSVLSGRHGLASGSGWTQLTETILQMFMAWRLQTRGQGIGDDFYWFSDMSADDMVEYLAKYGLPANPSKQIVSSVELHFLQRMFHQGYFSRESDKVLGAYYPTVRGLNSMLQPERYHKPKDWSSDMFCIRNYMILENCVDDPCFDEFLKFVVHGHKDMIPFAKKTDRELNAIQEKSREVRGLNPTYNQEKRDKPLSEFVSIKLARLL